MNFSELRLVEPLLRALITEGYTEATPIQAGAIPPVLEGRDLIGCAQTGTGKTAAFALPILQRLSVKAAGSGPAKMRCLVLCPTRELATQIADGFGSYGRHLPLKKAVIFGGVNQRPQVDALRRGTEIVIATPGRFLDLLRQGHINLSGVEVLVLDEADRMLDMGFIHDIRTIVAKLPVHRQTLLFSATLPPEIRRLADSLLKTPVTVQIKPVEATTELIDESVYFVERENKAFLLAHLVQTLPMSRSIVFTRTKHGADRLVKHLHVSGIKAEAIHSNKSQNARQRALQNFKIGKVAVLVATDIASRGIDVDNISHVVNYDLTHEPETYLHRIGRTGRAGATGAAVSFCDREEQKHLKAIERMIRRKVPVKTDHPIYPNRGSHSAPSRPVEANEERSRSHGHGGRGKPSHSGGSRGGFSGGGHSSGAGSHRERSHVAGPHSEHAHREERSAHRAPSRPIHATHSPATAKTEHPKKPVAAGAAAAAHRPHAVAGAQRPVARFAEKPRSVRHPLAGGVRRPH